MNSDKKLLRKASLAGRERKIKENIAKQKENSTQLLRHSGVMSQECTDVGHLEK